MKTTIALIVLLASALLIVQVVASSTSSMRAIEQQITHSVYNDDSNEIFENFERILQKGNKNTIAPTKLPSTAPTTRPTSKPTKKEKEKKDPKEPKSTPSPTRTGPVGQPGGEGQTTEDEESNPLPTELFVGLGVAGILLVFKIIHSARKGNGNETGRNNGNNPPGKGLPQGRAQNLGNMPTAYEYKESRLQRSPPTPNPMYRQPPAGRATESWTNAADNPLSESTAIPSMSARFRSLLLPMWGDRNMIGRTADPNTVSTQDFTDRNVKSRWRGSVADLSNRFRSLLNTGPATRRNMPAASPFTSEQLTSNTPISKIPTPVTENSETAFVSPTLITRPRVAVGGRTGVDAIASPTVITGPKVAAATRTGTAGAPVVTTEARAAAAINGARAAAAVRNSAGGASTSAFVSPPPVTTGKMGSRSKPTAPGVGAVAGGAAGVAAARQVRQKQAIRTAAKKANRITDIL